jgi:hypothetical protein
MRLARAALLWVVAGCVSAPAFADAARFQRYWKEAAEYARKGFAEADKAVAVMKTDKQEYCFRLSQVRTELERATKLYDYAITEINKDASLTEADRKGLAGLSTDYKSLKPIADRYATLQETRCLAGPSYSDTLPDPPRWTSTQDRKSKPDFDIDEHDAAEDDNF